MGFCYMAEFCDQLFFIYGYSINILQLCDQNKFSQAVFMCISDQTSQTSVRGDLEGEVVIIISAWDPAEVIEFYPNGIPVSKPAGG